MRGVVISGLSGSGKTAAIKVLEDLGYFCIDNLPVPLLRPFLELSSQSSEGIRKLALVIDARSRKFIGELPDTLTKVKSDGHHLELVFLTASDEVLVRRFSETRRRHPLAPEGSALEGVRKEREFLEPLLKAADHVIDTSDLKSSDLRSRLAKKFSVSPEKQVLSVHVLSFGFKFGIPLNADLVLDVRFLPNPFFREDLKRLNGTHPPVTEFVLAQADTGRLLKEYERLLRFLLPRYDREGKSYLTIAIGCTGGKHRSVVVASKVAEFCNTMGYQVTGHHRDLERE